MLNLKPTLYSSCLKENDISIKSGNDVNSIMRDMMSVLLEGVLDEELNVLAVENDIQPNLLRNWKKEFLANASLAFDNKREDNLREKLAEERKEKSEYAKKVGQLTMQVDWLKKKSEEVIGPDYESKFSPKPFDN